MSGPHKYIIIPDAPRGSELNPIPLREFDPKKLEAGNTAGYMRPYVYTIDERGQVCKHYRSYSDYCD